MWCVFVEGKRKIMKNLFGLGNIYDFMSFPPFSPEFPFMVRLSSNKMIYEYGFLKLFSPPAFELFEWKASQRVKHRPGQFPICMKIPASEGFVLGKWKSYRITV